jgi:hypothetical protein
MGTFLLVSLNVQAANGGSGTKATIGTGADAVTLVTVSGTPYEMGHWYGKPLRLETAQ